jgi:hypothetical protein
MCGWVLLLAALTNAQAVVTRKPGAPVTRSNEAQKRQSGSAAVRLPGDLKIVTSFYHNPCQIITREEIEAILKRSDTDRALVSVSDPIGRHPDVECFYSVRYENRIFPEEKRDNALSIVVDFDNEYAKQGKLIVDLQRDNGPFGRYSDRDMVLEIVNGLGDAALYARDKSKFTYEEKYKSTAGLPLPKNYLNQDFLYVRKKDVLLRFQIEKIVAGNTDGRNLIEIARKALERVP